jgi:copper chaperone CopZ
VVGNALRLNFKGVIKNKKENNTNDMLNDEIEHVKCDCCSCGCDNNLDNQQNMEEKVMEKTMVIEGMMCPHCEARVRKTLEGMDGVEKAVVSHESGTAVITFTKDIDNETLKSTIEAQGYPVLEIK